MFIRKRKLAYLVCAVFSLLLLLAEHSRADGAEDNATDWYFGGGMSLYVVDVPDYTPLWYADRTAGGVWENPSRLRLTGGPIATPLFEATLGKELADQWSVETRLEYAYVKNSYLFYERGNRFTRGVLFCPLDGFSTGLHGTYDNSRIELDFEFQQYGAALVAGKTYGGDDWNIRPFAGYWFQERDTTYKMGFDLDDNVPTFFSDRIETMYNGLLAGVQLALPMNGWDIELETTHGVAWAHTCYRGSWAGSHYETSLTCHKDKLAYRGTLQASASIPVEVDWDFNFTGELRYMSYVPRLISSGQANDTTLSDSPAHLVGDSSFSGKLGLEIVHSF